MWPFKKRPIPDPVTEDGVTATFSRDTEAWEFTIDGIDFNFESELFEPAAVHWAKSELPTILALMPEMIAAAKEEVRDEEENLINVESTELLSVDLIEYPTDGYLSVNFVGDETWGDLGVVVTLKDGAIFAVHSGD